MLNYKSRDLQFLFIFSIVLANTNLNTLAPYLKLKYNTNLNTLAPYLKLKYNTNLNTLAPYLKLKYKRLDSLQ